MQPNETAGRGRGLEGHSAPSPSTEVRADAQGLACTVTQIEFTGADTLLGCAPQAASATAAVVDAPRLQVLVHDTPGMSNGQSVRLDISPERVHVFDAVSGQRL